MDPAGTAYLGASAQDDSEPRANAESSSESGPRSRRRIRPAHAIMAALSVQYTGGGGQNRKCLFSASCAKRARSVPLAATPPAR